MNSLFPLVTTCEMEASIRNPLHRLHGPQHALGPHHPIGDAGVAEVADMSGMAAMKSLRDEAADGLPQRFRRRAAKDLLRGAVEEHDPLLFIDGDDRIRGRLNDARQAPSLSPSAAVRSGHAPLQFGVERIDFGPSPGADADLAADCGPRHKQKDHACERS